MSVRSLARTRAKPTTAPKQKLRIWLRLLRTTRGIENDLRARLRTEFGTTLPRFDVMAALARAPDGLTMTALSRQLLVSNGNITALIDGLVHDRMVVRVAVAGDRRSIIVRLTSHGESEFERMASTHAGWIDELFADLDADTCDQLDALLQRCGPANRKATP